MPGVQFKLSDFAPRYSIRVAVFERDKHRVKGERYWEVVTGPETQTHTNANANANVDG